MLLSTILASLLTSTAEINALSHEDFRQMQPFALEGRISAVLCGNHLIVEDSDGRTHIRNHAATKPQLGDKVRLQGRTEVDTYRQEQAVSTNLLVIGSGPAAPLETRSVAEIANGVCNFANVTVSGLITDIFQDDIDEKWSYLILESDGDSTYVTIPAPIATVEPLRRRAVTITGTVVPNHCAARRFVGPHLETTGPDNIRSLSQADGASVSPSPLASVNHLSPKDVIRLSPRTVEGRVLAGWGGRSLLVRSDDEEIHRIDLAAPADTLPAAGTRLRIIGMPETDLFRLNLSDAQIEILASDNERTTETPRVNPLSEKRSKWNLHFHGNCVRQTGTVLSEATARNKWRALVESEGIRLSVDISAHPELAEQLTVGSVAEITGCGLIEEDNWRPGTPFPQNKELVMVVRTPEDLAIMSRPPWWTPARLLAVIIALVSILLVITVWNRMLRRLVERRGRELFRQEIGRAEADLKTAERTRLAAEMHDALSQALTGISYQLEALDAARRKKPERLAHHLDLARRLLDNSREQLRTCIYDLRSNTLNEPDAELAIRKTVQPYAGNATLTINSTLRRNAFSDATFHDLLCILRELVSNAARHGHAKTIRLSTHADNETLSCTVTDDGCGFTVEDAPGSATGHFGLLGIRERLDRLNGKLSIDSAPGRGTIITFFFQRQS